MKTFFALLLSLPAVLGHSVNGDLLKREDPRISYYGDDATNLAGGACQFASLPSGLYGGAISKSLWDGSGACGQCVEIIGPSQMPVKVMVSAIPDGKAIEMADADCFRSVEIVDRCPGCVANHFDLFPNAFKAAGGKPDGRTYVTYKYVPCGITSPLSVRTEDGVSQWWFSMQVTEANKPVKSLDVSTDGGKTWQATQRRDYNFFQKLDRKGFGTKPVDIRINSQEGQSIIIKNVNADLPGKSFKGGSNFQ